MMGFTALNPSYELRREMARLAVIRAQLIAWAAKSGFPVFTANAIWYKKYRIATTIKTVAVTHTKIGLSAERSGISFCSVHR